MWTRAIFVSFIYLYWGYEFGVESVIDIMVFVVPSRK